MNRLPTRMALIFGALFMGLLAAAAVVAETHAWPALPLPAVVATIAVTLAAAWCVLQPLARRIERLADRMEALHAAGDAGPWRLPGADPAGDGAARLAASAERLSERLAEQAATVDRLARQRHELLANVSHDLRTPLASMQGYLELLLLRHGSLDPAEARNYLETAARQSERLARLVADLFELTRLEAGDVHPLLEPFSLAELAHDVAQKFGAEAERRGLALTARCGEADGAEASMPVRADIALVERALGILIDNAMRHTPSGGGVAIVIDRRGAAHARLAVCDSGAGIAADALPGIFERYERAARVGAAPAEGGSGLGLAMARHIAGLHGSALCVQSTPGQGTQVSFDLALAGRPANASRAALPGLAA